MKKTGRFITVEGGEGVGKSLFLDLFSNELKKLGIGLINTREPGGTPVAEKLRSIFSNPPQEEPLLIETEFFMVSAARTQHVSQLIKPALESNQWVLSDRFADSSRVYQGAIGKFPKDLLEAIIRASTFSIEPDITFILDCDLETIRSRIQHRTKNEESTTQKDGASRYDKGNDAFHKNLRQAFLDLAKEFPQRIVLLDASNPPDQLVTEALKITRNRLLQTKHGDDR